MKIHRIFLFLLMFCIILPCTHAKQNKLVVYRDSSKLIIFLKPGIGFLKKNAIITEINKYSLMRKRHSSLNGGSVEIILDKTKWRKSTRAYSLRMWSLFRKEIIGTSINVDYFRIRKSCRFGLIWDHKRKIIKKIRKRYNRIKFGNVSRPRIRSKKTFHMFARKVYTINKEGVLIYCEKVDKWARTLSSSDFYNKLRVLTLVTFMGGNSRRVGIWAESVYLAGSVVLNLAEQRKISLGKAYQLFEMILLFNKEYLFSVNLKYVSSLKRYKLTASLKKEFKKRGYTFTYPVKVRMIRRNHLWKVECKKRWSKGSKKYRIKRNENWLDVYSF